MSAAAKGKEGEGQTIRQYLAEQAKNVPLFVEQITETCRLHQIDLDSLWPPKFLKGREAKPADRPAADPPELEKQPPGQLILFPQWADTRRAAARAIFRAALFPALGRGKRQYLENHKIYSVRGVDVCFTGKQFDQSDLDVYLEILHIIKDQPSGADCTFSAYGLLKALGRATGKANHKWLHSVLIRLCGGVVDMTDHKKRYFGALLLGGIKDEITRQYVISVNPVFAKLLKATWASLDHEQRKRLKNNPTAKALHAYYSTHAAPGAHSVGTLADIAGLKNSNRRDLKARIIKAHDLLKSDEIGFLKDYEIEGDTIKTRIRHTTGQNRHIARKVIEGRKKQRDMDTV